MGNAGRHHAPPSRALPPPPSSAGDRTITIPAGDQTIQSTVAWRGFAVNRAIDPFYTSRPATCWCEEAKLTKVSLNAAQGDYLVLKETFDALETFKLVRHEKKGAKGTNGWAREHELGDFYKEAHHAAKAVETV